MVKLLRIVAFWLDLLLGMILAIIISIVVSSIICIFISSINISAFITIVLYFYFIYMFIINKNFVFTEGQSIFQKIFGLKIYCKDSLANKRICCKKNLIDLLTYPFGFITIIFFNKSIGDLLLDTTVVENKGKKH